MARQLDVLREYAEHDGYFMDTECEYCLEIIRINQVDPDGVLIGGECEHCTEYVTRYMPGMEPQ